MEGISYRGKDDSFCMEWMFIHHSSLFYSRRNEKKTKEYCSHGTLTTGHSSDITKGREWLIQAVETSYRIVAESISSRVPLSTVLRGNNGEDPFPIVYNCSICREWSGIESRKRIDYSLRWKYQFITPTEEGSHQLVHSSVLIYCLFWFEVMNELNVRVKMCKNVDFVRRGKESLELE